MHIISWNVAGWGPTYTAIVQHYGSLERFLDLHECDVLCLQETKVSAARAAEFETLIEAVRAGLEIDAVAEPGAGGAPLGATGSRPPLAPAGALGGAGSTVDQHPASLPSADHEEDKTTSLFPASLAHQRKRKWSAFFAFNRCSAYQGFNGVACFVRTDKYPVYGATQKVFYEDVFDNEGRALLVDFGTHRLLNIYAPFANSPTSSEERLHYKLRFLQKLEGRYFKRSEFEKNYTVLVGDFNVSWRKEDVKLARRLLEVDADGRVISGAPGELFPCALTWDEEDDDVVDEQASQEMILPGAGERGVLVAGGGGPRGAGAGTSGGIVGGATTSSVGGRGAPAAAKRTAKTTTSGAPSRRVPTTGPKAGAKAGGKALAKAAVRVHPNIADAFRQGAAATSSSSSQSGRGGAPDHSDRPPPQKDQQADQQATERDRPGTTLQRFVKNSPVPKRRFISCGFACQQLCWPLSSFRNYGLPRHMRYEYSSVVWLQKFLARKAIDVFAFVYGAQSAERFTVWNQFTSDRMSNNGSRIDFTLVSRPLFAKILNLQGTLTEEKAESEKNGAPSASSANVVYDSATGTELLLPPPDCPLRRIGYLEPEDASSCGFAGSSPVPLDLPGHRRPLERRKEHHEEDTVHDSGGFAQSARLDNPAGAALQAATFFGGWTARGFGSNEATEAQRDDMRLNNSQFQHSFAASRLFKLNHWSRAFPALWAGAAASSSTGNGSNAAGRGPCVRSASGEEQEVQEHRTGGTNATSGGTLSERGPRRAESSNSSSQPGGEWRAGLPLEVIDLDSPSSSEKKKRPPVVGEPQSSSLFELNAPAAKRRTEQAAQTRFLKKRRGSGAPPANGGSVPVRAGAGAPATAEEGDARAASSSPALAPLPIQPLELHDASSAIPRAEAQITASSSDHEPRGAATTVPLSRNAPHPHPLDATDAAIARLAQKRHVANMIYTPPSYSDHIMVSLRLPDPVLKTLEVRPLGIPAAQTLATHPWRGRTRDMFEFMGGKGGSGSGRRNK